MLIYKMKAFLHTLQIFFCQTKLCLEFHWNPVLPGHPESAGYLEYPFQNHGVRDKALSINQQGNLFFEME